MVLDSTTTGRGGIRLEVGAQIAGKLAGRKYGGIVQGPRSLSPLAALQVRGSLMPSAFS